MKKLVERVLLPALVLVALRPGAAEDLSPDQIVSKCLGTTNRDTHLRDSYTYQIRDEIRNLNGSGHVTAVHSRVIEILYFAEKPYEHLLQKDGKKLTPGELKREDQKMDQAAAEAANLSEQQRAERKRKLDRERDKQNEFLQYIPAAYHFRLESQIQLNGRPTYVISAAPKQDYSGKYASLLRSVEGKFFIDEHDFTMARLEAYVLDKVSFGLFLARLSKGTRLTFEQLRVNDEIWLPKDITMHADARALVKKFRFDEELVFSDYRKFQSESHIVTTGNPTK